MLAAWLLALGTSVAHACLAQPTASLGDSTWSSATAETRWVSAHRQAAALAPTHGHFAPDAGSSDGDPAEACAACRTLCPDETKTLPRAESQGFDAAAHAVAISDAAWRRAGRLPVVGRQHATPTGASPRPALSAAIRFQRFNL